MQILKQYTSGACPDTRANNYAVKSLDITNKCTDPITTANTATCSNVFNNGASLAQSHCTMEIMRFDASCTPSTRTASSRSAAVLEAVCNACDVLLDNHVFTSFEKILCQHRDDCIKRLLCVQLSRRHCSLCMCSMCTGLSDGCPASAHQQAAGLGVDQNSAKISRCQNADDSDDPGCNQLA